MFVATSLCALDVDAAVHSEALCSVRCSTCTSAVRTQVTSTSLDRLGLYNSGHGSSNIFSRPYLGTNAPRTGRNNEARC
ncbi:hypothetical protein L226DRAFT_39906 [Lentinus tigrinus ALCF2SS1-7]|uniref:uncharacterized protein n=1 Tax=Lentinus tigrinus ALCF2SS1-7 TaxID=1328758 RepID=UPI001166200D|nr:hypothetical protein L226DRAFT_39906 [Lentinus tigrinus ALCF2SS1-7]